ncbi:uncharacterized protein G2W53_010356 [Senna tora]|uniref:Uncharacterized protein n=1 Tax=Senna tora TaxID=362788 RepID=A0A834X0U0_9FABA|nr:uncharacterized protein G2W53_010356 [Senna tora]
MTNPIRASNPLSSQTQREPISSNHLRNKTFDSYFVNLSKIRS